MGHTASIQLALWFVSRDTPCLHHVRRLYPILKANHLIPKLENGSKLARFRRRDLDPRGTGTEAFDPWRQTDVAIRLRFARNSASSLFEHLTYSRPPSRIDGISTANGICIMVPVTQDVAIIGAGVSVNRLPHSSDMPAHPVNPRNDV